MKILVIRFSSIGDIVLTTPVLRCLKTQLPDVEVHFLTKPVFATILEANPYVAKIWHLEKDWKGMVHKLKKEQYDLIVDLHHNLRTLRLKYSLFPVRSVSFKKLNWQKWLLTQFKKNILPPVHIVDRYLDTVHFLGVHKDGKGLDYFLPENTAFDLSEKLFPLHSKGYIGIVIGASYETKKLPKEKLIELCAAVTDPVVLLGGKEDREMGEILRQLDTGRIYNACGIFSLNESAFLVKNAKAVVTHDTGLMHIAAAFDKPVISVWGNTVPAFGMYPYYGDKNIFNREFEVAGLSCRPCSKIGFHHCPQKHFRCMRDQDVDAIAKITNDIFNA